MHEAKICFLLTSSLLNQGFLVAKLKSSLRKLYGRHHHLVNHRICNKINKTGATCGAETAYPSGASAFTPQFLVEYVLLDFLFSV